MKDLTVKDNLIDGKYRFQDLVDIKLLEEMFNDFSITTGFTVGITSYPKQEVLLKTGWRDACLLFHRKFESSKIHCTESNIEITKGLEQQKTYNIYPCKSGLVDGATPIIVEGVHIANLFTGQIFFEKPNIEKFKKQGADYGFDVDSYIKSIKKVPVVSEEKFLSALKYLSNLTVILAKQALLKFRAIESEKKLALNEEKYRIIFENSPLGIITFDPKGNIIDANKSILKIIGLSSLEHIRKINILDSEDFMKLDFITDFKICIKNKKSNVNQSSYTTFGDKEAIMRYFMTPNFDNENNLQSIHCIFEDYTKQRKSEEKIKQSEEKFKSLIENSVDIISIIDENGKTIFNSLSLEKNLGHTAGYNLQRDIFKHIVEEDKIRLQAQFQNNLNKFGTTEEIHFRVYHRNSEIRYMEGSAKNMLNHPMIKGIVANYRDVTNQRNIESEVRKLSKAVETSNQSIIITDLEGTITYVNKTLLKNGLWDNDKELIGNKLYQFADKLASNTIMELIIPTILENGFYNGELTFKRKDGSTYIGDTNCTLILDNEGNPEFFVGMFTDVTDLKKHQEILKRERDALARFKKITINRELNALKLKEEINQLLGELGREKKYATGKNE